MAYMWPSCEIAVIHQPGRTCAALHTSGRRLQREALQLTWLVGLGTKAVVREYVRLTWVEL